MWGEAEGAVIGSYAVGDRESQRSSAKATNHVEAGTGVARERNPVQGPVHGTRIRRLHKNPVLTIVGKIRIGHGKTCDRVVGVIEAETVGGEVADDTILDAQQLSAEVVNPIDADARSVDKQTVQVDLVGVSRTDRDPGAAARHADSGEAVALDANRLGDGDNAVASGVEHVDLAARSDYVVGVLEGAAGLGEGARIAVQALRRDEDAGLRVRRVGMEREREHGRS